MINYVLWYRASHHKGVYHEESRWEPIMGAMANNPHSPEGHDCLSDIMLELHARVWGVSPSSTYKITANETTILVWDGEAFDKAVRESEN